MIRIDLEARTPPYQQIRQEIATAIADGSLTPGTKLPPIRQLARDLGLALNTVARAYHELELDGLVHTNGRRGTVVASAPVTTSAELDAEVTRFVARARDLGADRRLTIALVIRALG